MESKPLLDITDSGDEEKQWINDYYDDSSSGYDSTDTWDTESVTSSNSYGGSVSSCDIEENFTRSGEIRDEVVKFSSPTSLCDRLKLILEMPDLCDVTFLVGPEKTSVHGLKAVLSVRSRVFHQLIVQHLHMRKGKKAMKSSKSAKLIKRRETTLVLQERVEIPVHKYDVEVFRMLIQFVHCGTASITQQNVSGLLCGAVQFELPELASACWEFIENCLTSGRGESLLVPTRAYAEHDTSRLIFDKIYKVLDRRFISPYQAVKSFRKESCV